MKVRDEAASLWTLPNRLSILRILFIPIIVLFIASREDGLLLASCLLFIIAGITDGLDGYLARKMSLTSRLGLYLDPIADKLLVTSVLITLTYYHQVPLWVTLILVGGISYQWLACFLCHGGNRNLPVFIWENKNCPSTYRDIMFAF